MKLRVQGQEVDVILTEDIANVAGWSSVFEGKIRIDPRQPKSQVESTLLHEIIEHLNKANDIGLEHSQICTLEVGLYQVLTENSKLDLEELYETKD